VHAGRLAANERLRTAVAGLAESGAAIAAECAGLLYLARSLDGEPMCGVLDTDATMTGRLTLGYREATAMTDSVLAVAGTVVRGHEFHRTGCVPASPADLADPPPNRNVNSSRIPGAAAWHWSGSEGTNRVEGFVHGRIHASYLHLHWAGLPSAATNLVGAARLATIKADAR
jgi:cobyrinic acid a,c-diamide synthase